MTAYLKTISVCRLSDVSCLSPSQISDSELLHWKQLVAKCMTEYCSSECNKPDNKKLVWIVSRRTAQNLQANHFSVPGLPTIPEGSWDVSERLVVQFSFMLHFHWLNILRRDGETLTKCSFLNGLLKSSWLRKITAANTNLKRSSILDPWMIKCILPSLNLPQFSWWLVLIFHLLLLLP